MRICMLGGFRVSVGERVIEEDEWRLKKAGSLIKLLALAPGRRLHREQAMDLLWPEHDSEAAANNLHHALHVARRILEPAAPASSAASRYLLLRDQHLALCSTGPLWVDVEAFEEAASTARHIFEPAAYRAAIELYSGDLLLENLYEAWAQDRREDLRMTYLALLVELAGLYEEREEYGPAIEVLGKAVTAEPTHEGTHMGLMRLYALLGRRREALGQYERLREALFEEFGGEPGAATVRLHEEIRAGVFPRAHWSAGDPPPEEPPAEVGRHNLPLPLTSFIGRVRALLEIKRLLAMSRLLTLTGAGGCGKTRLALEVSRDLAGAYPDGAWLVELASVLDPALAPWAVAKALDVTEQPGRSLEQTLSDYLRGKRLLLVLDNCEHLLDACARLVDTLLGSCAGLRILATSREALGVAGEAGWPVLPLAAPAEELSSVEDLGGYEAVRLFVERARSKLPTFELTPQNARAVVDVCRKLDGIPLAIELAAARVTALAVEQVAARLADSLELLTGGSRTADPRHQTLRATLAWSYDLLSEPEQKPFRRFSVFVGGWTLEAAEAVGEGAGIPRGKVLDLLSKLVEKSLVIAEAGARGELRYRMLEPIRQYGRERLEESSEAERVRERHARYYLTLGEAAEPGLIGAGQVAWLERLQTEYSNLRAALDWCLDENAESEEHAALGLRLAAALGRFWNTHGPSEGREWLEKGLARNSALPTALRVKALNEAGFIAAYQVDPRAIAMLEEALALSKELEDKSAQAISICNVSHAVAHVGDHARITTLREEAEALLEEPLDRRAAAYLLLSLGVTAELQRDYEQMVGPIEKSLALFREIGDLRSCAMCLTTMGLATLYKGDAGRAAAFFEEDLRLLRELKDKVGTIYGLIGMAAVAILRGRLARAARLFGAADALREAIGHPLTPLLEINYDYEGYLATTRTGLGEAAFDAAFSEGRAISPERAIEYALSEEEQAPPTLVPEPEQLPTERLTRRQREVALLVARGLSNRRIAEELVLSEHTVAAHLRKILEKLELHSRAQIGARLTE